MKKGLAAILVIFYLAAVSGVGMNMHYCCGVLNRVELSYTVPGGHAVCGMQSAYQGKNCCRDVHKEFKITQAQNTVSDIACPAVYAGASLLPLFSPSLRADFSAKAKSYFLPHAPPFRESEPVYLRNCSFLI